MPATIDSNRFIVGVFPSPSAQIEKENTSGFPKFHTWYTPTDSGVRNAILFGSEIVLFAADQGSATSAKDQADFLATQGVSCYDGFEEIIAVVSHYFGGKPTDSFRLDPEALLIAVGAERASHVRRFVQNQKSLEIYQLGELAAKYAGFRCQAIVGNTFSMKVGRSWTPWQGVAELQRAIQKICLPDVSALPIDDILQIQSNCADLLVPMRAELLRLSKNLRESVKSTDDRSDIAREAEFLVQTDILPVVMETSTLVTEELRKRDKDFAYKIIRFAAIAGLGFLLPDAIKFMPTVIDKAIDSVEAAHQSLSKSRPPTRTAQFVIEVRDSLPV
jgi:hypothetical protein